jgi:hypothetical protein
MNETVVASASFVGESPRGNRFEIGLQVHAPRNVADNEWECVVELRGLYEDVMPVRGEDSLQALCLALGLAGKLLRGFVGEGGKIHFADGMKSEVPLDAYFGARE